jgi:polyisoprenoid-binding protein YceI
MISLPRFVVSRLGPSLLLAGTMLAVGPAGAATYALDPAKSSLSTTFKLSGVAAGGQFRKFAGSAEFDPAKPAETRAQFDVETTSFDLGDPDYNAELGKKDWFDTARYPKAAFVSKLAKSTGPGKLEITGRLTIKGKSTDLTFPVTYRQEGQGYVFEGAAPVKRLAYSLGEGEWKDTGVLDDEVRIKFTLALVPRK